VLIWYTLGSDPQKPISVLGVQVICIFLFLRRYFTVTLVMNRLCRSDNDRGVGEREGCDGEDLRGELEVCAASVVVLVIIKKG
jgi:hypothetical protein